MSADNTREASAGSRTLGPTGWYFRRLTIYVCMESGLIGELQNDARKLFVVIGNKDGVQRTDEK